MGILPPKRPQITREECKKILKAKGIYAPAVIGIRGYYLDSMGTEGVNDRGIYDDAIAVIAFGEFEAFNANTDPSISRPKVAVLVPGVWPYKKGIHGLSKPVALRYQALVQAGEVTVDRDFGAIDTGMFGINIHRGGLISTSSLGCQTIYPLQWPRFKSLVYAVMDRANIASIAYVLITEAERREIART